MYLWSQLLERLRQENYLNPGGGGCGDPEIAPLHSSLGNKSKTPSQKKKKAVDLAGHSGSSL